MVLVVHVNKENERGSAKVYVDGIWVGEEALFGRCIVYSYSHTLSER